MLADTTYYVSIFLQHDEPSYLYIILPNGLVSLRLDNLVAELSLTLKDAICQTFTLLKLIAHIPFLLFYLVVYTDTLARVTFCQWWLFPLLSRKENKLHHQLLSINCTDILQVADWMKTHHESDLSESDYGMRIDLITKVFGASAAEDFFEKLPPGAKSLEAYTALLHSYGRSKMTDKAERLFERMKDANLSMDALVYNEMMTLYISVGELDKVEIIAEELKKQNVSPDLFTYNLRVSAAAASMNLEGFKGILNEMSKDPNSKEGWTLYRNLAFVYVDASQLVGSGASLVEAEAKISQREWITYDFLLILHAGLGNQDRIKDIWKSMVMTSQRMTSRNYICVLSSYLMCGQLKDAGEIVDQWQRSKAPEFDISACNRLLDALLSAGLTDTADRFRELMLQKSCILTSRATVVE